MGTVNGGFHSGDKKAVSLLALLGKQFLQGVQGLFETVFLHQFLRFFRAFLRPADGADETESVAYYVIPLPKPDPQPPAAPSYAPYPPQGAPQPQVEISGGQTGSAGSGIEVIRGTSVTRGQ